MYIYIYILYHKTGAPAGQPDHIIISAPLPALIVNYTRHDENVNDGKVPDYSPAANNRRCIIS
jgi:hypothetical protein